MAILISDMDMPRNCLECLFDYEMYTCLLTGKNIHDEPIDCPLIEVTLKEEGETDLREKQDNADLTPLDTEEYITNFYTKYGPY